MYYGDRLTKTKVVYLFYMPVIKITGMFNFISIKGQIGLHKPRLITKNNLFVITISYRVSIYILYKIY